MNGKEVHAISVGAAIPATTNHIVPGTTTGLAFSGDCHDYDIDGAVPYTHYSTFGAARNLQNALAYDAMRGPHLDGIDVALLAKRPLIKMFPVNYTQPTGVNGNEHVVANGVLTIAVLAG